MNIPAGCFIVLNRRIDIQRNLFMILIEYKFDFFSALLAGYDCSHDITLNLIVQHRFYTVLE